MNSASLLNIQKYIAFLCTNNEISEREIFFKIPFKSHIKKKKNPRNKLNQGGEKPICWKLYKTLIKEMERYPMLLDWKNIKMAIIPKAVYTFNSIPIKILRRFFSQNWNNPKICTELQKTMNCQSNLRKKSKAGGMTLPGFRVYYKATVIKEQCCSGRKTDIEQCHREESPEIKPCPYSQWIYKGGKNIQWRKDRLFQQVVLGKLDSHM